MGLQKRRTKREISTLLDSCAFRKGGWVRVNTTKEEYEVDKITPSHIRHDRLLIWVKVGKNAVPYPYLIEELTPIPAPEGVEKGV